MSLAVSILLVQRAGQLVLTALRFEARPGEVLVVAGANGAGKSTLLRAVLGLVPMTGSVTLDGQPLPTDPGARARLLAYVPQRSGLGTGLTAWAVVAQGRFPGLGALARLGPTDAVAVDAALRRTDARHLAERPFTQLSAGEQQRVLIARALATGAPVLLMDEPTAALDTTHARALDRLLRSLAAEGRTVIAVLHEEDEIRRTADRVLVLEGGRLVAQGTPAEVLRPVVESPDPGPVAGLPPPFPPQPPATRRAGAFQIFLALASIVAAVAFPVVFGHARPSAVASGPAVVTVSDARGHAVPVRPYARIASLSLTADAVLAEVVAADRVVVACAYSRGLQARRWAGRPRLPALDDVEAVIAARPDLVIAASTAEDRLARLQEAGIPVLIHGDMGGFADYLAATRLIATAVGAADLGERHARTLERRRAAVPVPAVRPPVLYLAAYGDLLTGGTVGSGFHDLITAAGGQDVAALHFRGWPTYAAEQVIALAPAVIVHPASQDLRQRPGLDRLAVRWVALPDEVLEDPTGPGLLEAADLLHDRLSGIP